MLCKKSILGLCLAMAYLAAGCSTECEDGECTNADYGVGEQYSVSRAALSANCSISVEGFGVVDMETDYVPHVVLCENGGSNAQGLRVQAVAARTYAYKYLKDNPGKNIKNSEEHQVYACGKEDKTGPGQTYETIYKNCLEAVEATDQQVLTYKDKVIAAMFVAGAKADYLDNTCRYKGGSSESTQKYVTYNAGKSGDDLSIQSSLGLVTPGNDANRGCMSQNGATCLGEKGYDYTDILKFFYADDITIETAEGSCKVCETVLDRSGVVIDEFDACFKRKSTSSWYDITNGGYNGHLYYTYVWDKEAQNVGTWNVNVTRPGTYEVFAYIEKDIGAMSEKAPYVVRASGVEHQVDVNLALNNGWVSIGKFAFAAGGDQWVRLSDASGEKYTGKSGKRIVFDAIKFVDASGCSDACVENAKQCQNNGVQTCERNAATGCTEWSAAIDCGSLSCVNGVCDSGANCDDECTDAGNRECSGGGYRVCGNFDADRCLEWSDVTPCGNGELCTGAGICPSDTTCTNECNPAESRCQGGGYVLCGNYDSDACLEWGTTEIACNSDEVCKSGTCVKRSSVRPDAEPWNGVVGEKPADCQKEVDGHASVIIDDQDACFVRSKSASWSELIGYGYSDHLYYTYVKENNPSAVGTWHLNVKQDGRYAVYAYIENGVGKVSIKAPYVVGSANGKEEVTIDVWNSSGWYYIGTYTFAAGLSQYVLLLDAFEGGDQNIDKRLLFDAIQVVPSGTKVENAVTTEDGEGSGPSQGGGNTEAPGESDGCSSMPSRGHSGGGAGVILAMFGAGLWYRRRKMIKN